MGQYRERQETILWTVKERNNVVRVSFSLSILKLAEVSDCNDSMRRVVVILLLFFSAHPKKKICVNRSGKTVKDRKISKTDLDSYDTEVPPVAEFGGVARAICSQEHLPSFLFFGHYAKTV